jgi:hypothetical protein
MRRILHVSSHVGIPINTDDLVKIEQYRRFLRPDWRRLLPPEPERGLTREQREALRHDFMLRDRAFETPLARRLRKEREEREREEQEARLREEKAALQRERQEREWEAECAERKLRADLAWERFKAAFMRGDFAPRQKANFNQNQPRVAAGNPDGGQWTSEGDGTEHADDKPQLVQDRTDRLLNDHIIRNHVAKTDEELKARIRAEQLRGLFTRSGMDRNGSFDSIESARDFIGQTIANNPSDVAQVANGQLDGKFLIWRFGYQTGREAILDTPDSEIRMRPTYEVGVLIVHDPRAISVIVS